MNEVLTADHSCAIKYFWKTLVELWSTHLYASFGTFCFIIGQIFVAQWNFKHSEEFRNRIHFPSMTAICRFSNMVTVTRIKDRFGCKRCQKKRKDVDFKLLLEFSKKYLVVHKRLAVKNSFSTYVYYEPDGFFERYCNQHNFCWSMS